MPHRPSPAQTAFLLLEDLEAFYGGAAGGGKSDALLMAALQYVDRSDYAALILRKSFTDLSLPGAIMDRAHGWLAGSDAEWNDRDHRWTFPSGAVLQFGYLERAKDRYRYQSAEFQFVGFDELTQFTVDEYLYLFTRTRRLADSTTPIRVRSASNPGNIGHEWVRSRFIPQTRTDVDTGTETVIYPLDPETGRRRPFIPARLMDNPHIDRESYIDSLSHVDPILRKQMLDGDWTASKPGNKFRRDWFTIIDRAPRLVRQVRYWDLASTEETGDNDPDWTAGAHLGLSPGGEIIICDMRRMRGSAGQVEAFITAAAQRDNPDAPGFPIWIEQEPGSAGKAVVSSYQRRVLPSYTVRGHVPTGDKWTRADVLASRAESGQVFLVRGPWIEAFLSEAEAFSEDGSHSHDDMVDAAVGAYVKLSEGGTVTSTQYQKPAAPDIVRRGDLVLRGAKYVDRR